MKIKVCGMREADNLWAIAELEPDLLGFVFYAKSARDATGVLDPAQVRSLPPAISRVGVFVDEALPTLLTTCCQYNLDYAQLHGHETPDYCRQVRANGARVIKAFAVDAQFDFTALAAYAPHCDLFLFDTKGPLPGGNGTAFDWSVLANYTGPTPFLLGGGLGPATLPALLDFHHPHLYGLDFNSQLETAPGRKDVARTRALLTRLREQSTNC